MLDFTLENISAEDVERLWALYEPLAQSVRELTDATVRTQADAATGKSWCEFHLGAACAGPSGHVHGGVAAVILDHLLGEAASDGINPRLTGTISFRYMRATGLGQLHAEATTTRVDGVKTFAAGHLADEEGVTAEAEGVFILTR
jgi:acyl-coenzyme A thioesterase PaaI-like protein